MKSKKLFWSVVIILAISILIVGCKVATTTTVTGVETILTVAVETDIASNETAATEPAAEGNKAVKVNGAINKTFTPVRFDAGTFGNGMRIYVYEPIDKENLKLTDTITIDSSSILQVGSYPFENSQKGTVTVPLYAIYQVGEDPTGSYNSIKGTLTLTAAGAKYSGQFQFTAEFSTDASKTIEVTGSFTDLPFNKYN